jgi:hypothetical protein
VDAEDRQLAALSLATNMSFSVEWPGAPYAVGRWVSVTVGNPVDGILTVEAEVARVGEGASAELVLRLHGPLRSQQRRNQVRLAVDIPARRTLWLRHGKDPVTIRSRVLDVSAGGLRLQTDHELRAGERLVLGVTLPGEGHELHLSLVVRHNSHQTEKTRSWEAGCQFLVVRPVDREHIARYVFAQQREAARWRRSLTA